MFSHLKVTLCTFDARDANTGYLWLGSDEILMMHKIGNSFAFRPVVSAGFTPRCATRNRVSIHKLKRIRTNYITVHLTRKLVGPNFIGQFLFNVTRYLANSFIILKFWSNRFYPRLIFLLTGSLHRSSIRLIF